MSFYLEAVRHKPQSLFMMDDTTPLQDYSGYGRTGTTTGTPTRHPGLVSGAEYAAVLDNSNTASIDAPVFVQGYESHPFSISANIFPIKGATNSDQRVLSHSGHYDGLSIDGTKVSFSTKYLATGEAKCTYDLQVYRAAHVVGVHTSNKNSLFVDGVLVSEVEITAAQMADSYVATDGKLYTGASAGASKIAVNALSVFAHALTPAAIAAINASARNVPDGADVANVFNGRYIPLSREASNVFVEQWWQTASEWKAASLRGVAVIDDRLVPQFNGTTSISGHWIDSVPLTGAGTTSIYGVNFDWNGEGAVVEVSLDGASWSPVTRGVNVSVIPEGFNPTNKELLVRVSFPGGIVDDESYMDNLNMVGVKTGTSTAISGNPLTLTGAFQQKKYRVLEMHDNWGAEISSGGSIVIGPDIASPAFQPKTIELWIKPTSAVQPTVSVAGTKYQNGLANNGSLPQDQWVVWHITTPTAVTGNITITGPAQIGQVVVYGTELSAAEVANVSRAYTGIPPQRASDSSTITVSQSAESATIYAHDWSIVGAG